MDCGSLLPLSAMQPAASGAGRGFIGLFRYPCRRARSRAASPKATAGCSSPRFVAYKSGLFQKLLLCLHLLSAAAASAQETKPPQVLFLGDSIHRAIVQDAAKELGKKVTLHYPPKDREVSNSRDALERIDELLGKKDWDIIYFNFGIGDLFYRDPATKEIRIMSKHAGGVRVSTPAEYEKQLNALVKQLKATDAKLIWGHTTPMVNVNFFPSFQGNLFEANAEREYNTIAARVMKKHEVPVLDLHSHVMAQFKADDKHPAYHKYVKVMKKRGHPLHAPLVNALLHVSR